MCLLYTVFEIKSITDDYSEGLRLASREVSAGISNICALEMEDILEFQVQVPGVKFRNLPDAEGDSATLSGRHFRPDIGNGYICKNDYRKA
jgi:hypothetical protein